MKSPPSPSIELAYRRLARSDEREGTLLPSNSPLMGLNSSKSRNRCSWRLLFVFLGLGLIGLVLIPVRVREALVSERILDFYEMYYRDDTIGKANSGGTSSRVGIPIIEEPYQQYTIHPNGHLVLEDLPTYDPPLSIHPIEHLISAAKTRWNKLLSSQSKSLDEAVTEYRARYARNPPKGFDKWYNYAVKNNIQLVDEYNQIHNDLEPFWALEPSDLLHRLNVMQDREETFTILIENGKTLIQGEQAFLRRAKDLGDLIGRFSSQIPHDVEFTFTRHDQPAVQLSWFHKERLLELAKMGEYFGPSNFIEEHEISLSNWANGCSPDSPLRSVEQLALNSPVTGNISGKKFKSHSPAYQTELSMKKSFISDHQKAMDICLHPEIMPLHGFTTSIGTNSGPLVPLFTFAKTNIHSDILVTPLEQYSDTYIGYDPDFDKKEENKLLWRGSTTGVNFNEEEDWSQSQRARLHFLTNEKLGDKKVIQSNPSPLSITTLPLSTLNDEMMDISFSGGPVQCSPKTCAHLLKVIEFKQTMGLDESYQYKYVFDVDGNGWSGRFHRLLSMKAATLKSTLFPEWYSDRIMPWVQ